MSCTHTGTTQNIARGGGIFAIIGLTSRAKSAVVAKRTKVSELKADSHDLSFTLFESGSSSSYYINNRQPSGSLSNVLSRLAKWGT